MDEYMNEDVEISGFPAFIFWLLTTGFIMILLGAAHNFLSGDSIDVTWNLAAVGAVTIAGVLSLAVIIIVCLIWLSLLRAWIASLAQNVGGWFAQCSRINDDAMGRLQQQTKLHEEHLEKMQQVDDYLYGTSYSNISDATLTRLQKRAEAFKAQLKFWESLKNQHCDEIIIYGQRHSVVYATACLVKPEELDIIIELLQTTINEYESLISRISVSQTMFNQEKCD